MILSVLFATVHNCVGILSTHFVGKLVNHISDGSKISMLLIGILILFALLNPLTSYSNHLLGQYTAERAAHSLRMGFMRHLLKDGSASADKAMSIVQGELTRATDYLSNSFFGNVGMLITSILVFLFLLYENPIHDTNENAAYIAHQLSHLGDVNESYSYWTFGDVFEEAGIPHTQFHGGFGLVAAGGVRKPTFWTFAFFKRLQELSGRCIYKDEECVIVESSDKKEVRGIVWNRGKKTLKKSFTLPVKEASQTMIRKTVDPVTTNPLKLWHDIGEPAAPSKDQIALLKQADSPAISSKILTAVNGEVELDFSVRGFGVEYFTLKACEMTSDRHYRRKNC